MSATNRYVALAIGVSDTRPMPYLAGAINGAREFHAWAQAFGYDSRLLIDEDGPVTFDGLRIALEALVTPSPTPVHRLLVYFAGHGFIREAEQGLWLLSRSHDEMRAVAVEQMRHRLRLYGVRQVGIFADACRSLPADFDTTLFTDDGVLTRGPLRDAPTPEVDKFIATQDGAETFMVPGANPADDRCIFSGVLLEGLWGTKPSAFSKIQPGRITSGSIGAYLKTEVPALAKKYEYDVLPTVLPTFAEGDNVYYGDGAPSAPSFPAWPAPGLVKIAMAARTTLGVRATRGPILEHHGTPPRSFQDRINEIHAPTHYETGAGFAVEGGVVAAAWVGQDLFAEDDGTSRWWWRVGQQQGYRLNQPAPMLIELDGGLFLAGAALPNFIASVLCDARGASAVVYREINGLPRSGDASVEALDRMESGGLRADDAIDLAVELRESKHSDPVLGVVGAYLYDSIGDVDSIRRMAWAYVAHGQPIPYDVALLGHLRAVGLTKRLLHVSVPAVRERKPRTAEEARAVWTHQATPEARGIVAGNWPLMRQGWTFLDDLGADEATIVDPGLTALIPRLTRSRFATLDSAGAHTVAALFGLTRHAGPVP